MNQTSYRWRNDDGDVYSAKWKDSINTPLILADNNNIRLRIQLIIYDTVSANFSLGYKENHYNKPWIMINRSEKGKFMISPSNWLSDRMTYSGNQLLPFSDVNYNFQQAITFDSSDSYYTKLSDNSLYEFEYSIKPSSDIKPGSVYFFSVLKNGEFIPCQDEEAVLMTPPISWYTQSFETKYDSNVTDIRDLSFVDANIGTAVGTVYNAAKNSGLILRTTDGGVTWTRQNCPFEGIYYLNDVCFTSADVGTVVGDGGIILRTTNGGKDWSSSISGLTHYFHSVSFAGADTGIVIGSDSQGTLILRTVNGGREWEHYLNMNARLSSVHLINSKIGYMVGEAGTIQKTSDGGRSWFSQSSGITRQLLDASFPDINNGYAVGEGIIIKTTDGGGTWSISFDNIAIQLNSIYFINKDIGWAAGAEGMLIKTTDGGNTWSILPICSSQILHGVQFVNEKTGWVLGKNRIFKTANGGIATIVNEYKEKNIPENFYLSQNYPNPFNPETKIKYSLPQKAFITITICDILGREVVRLVNEEKTAGSYEVQWNAGGLPSGIYFYQIKAGDYIEAKKMILTK
ncbi:MAG: YCF48-related protein [Syntrophothermus sp.]